jgi:heme exporter protein B
MMLFFAAMLALVFSFAFIAPSGEMPGAGAQGGDPANREVLPSVAGGILWVAVAFAGTLGLGRAFDREREGDTMRALLMAPVDRGAVFLGKALGIALFMIIVEAAMVPLVAILFSAPVLSRPVELAGLLILATIAFATVGSVFAAMLLRSRAREVLLPVMLFPVIVPALIAGTKGTSAIWMVPPELAVAHFWLKFLGVFDAIFLSVALWAFESLVVE